MAVNDCGHAVTVVDDDPVSVGILDPDAFEYQKPEGGLTGDPGDGPIDEGSLTDDEAEFDDVF